MTLHQVNTGLVSSITDAKADPQGLLNKSEGLPVCVLKNNAPAFYLISPKEYDYLIDCHAQLKNIHEQVRVLPDGRIMEEVSDEEFEKVLPRVMKEMDQTLRNLADR